MSSFQKYKNFDEFEVWKYTPDLLRAFPFLMENITWSWRVRCIMEFFVGYEVYYIKIQEQWAGYCVISSGRNKRYKFSNNTDIIFGRYFIAKDFRGQNLSVKMLNAVLNKCDISYNTAYAYVHDQNIASNKTMKKIGAVEVGKFFIKGLLRNNFEFNSDGDFILYKYEPK